ncbi:MAG: DNA translocase FtsK 4TM domain-containing protein [Bacteroidia bacterium]
MAVKSNKFKKNIEQDSIKNSNKEFKNPFKGLIGIFQNERAIKITGLFLLLFSIFCLFAFVSYLFTWKYDQDKLLGSFFSLLFDTNLLVENWLGKAGALISHRFIYNWFGLAAFLFPFLFFITGFKILFGISITPLKKSWLHGIISAMLLSAVLGFVFFNQNQLFAGAFGYHTNIWLKSMLGNIGTGLILLFLALSYGIIIFNFSFKLPVKNNKVEDIEEKETEETELPTNKLKENHLQKENNNTLQNNEQNAVDNDEKSVEKSEEINLKIDNIHQEKVTIIEEQLKNEEPLEEIKEEIKKDEVIQNQIVTDDKGLTFEIEKVSEENAELSAEEIEQLTNELGKFDPTLDLSSYQIPTIELLEKHSTGTAEVSKEELEANKNRIVETLRNYSIEIQHIKATIGPTVTLYEIVPEAGVRISKIKNLEDDIALSLSALGIRIIAPIPGKGTIGIEVPNKKAEIVSMRSLIASEKFQNTEMELPVALGKTISGEVFIADLAKMPHLLMAGATGQGKSVGLNAILVSLLYKKHPSQIKFVLVDPKKVELSVYAKIERHFLAKLPDADEPIITDNKKVIYTLNSLCIEMDNRYELLKGVARNIKEYNAKFINRQLNPNNGHRYLPYIVVVIDEFADLIMTAGKEVETPIARIAQLARAVGIHLIIATQRPSVNVITGIIKANFPARIAFRVTSKIDSRTILDTGGAEQLIGRGDMLYSTGNELTRIQCGFVDTPEVERITEFIGSQRGYDSALLLPEFVGEEENNKLEFDSSDRDALFDEAARIIVQHQQGSASLLQRKLKLGYNRAGRLIDQLEAAGIIGPFEGSKARQVLITDLNSLEQFLNNLNNKN